MTLQFILNLLGPFEGLAATAIAGIITPYIIQWLHIRVGDSRRSYIQDAITNAIKYAISVAAKEPNNTDLLIVKDDIIKTAKMYLQTMVPEALKALGMKSDAQLEQMLEASLASDLDALSALFNTLVVRNGVVKAAEMKAAKAELKKVDNASKIGYVVK